MLLRYLLSITLFLFLIYSCGKPGTYKIDYRTLYGYVVIRESCHADDQKDFWVIDFSYQNSQPLVGDTITINGVFYTNALKVHGLDPKFKVKGTSVGIGYKIISSSIIVQQDCDKPQPQIYPLKELVIYRQAELR